MEWRVDTHSPVPPSRQLVETALDAIARGELGPGDRMPSVRALAAEALVNPNTVSKAYRDLEHLGATAGKNGSGVYVTPEGPDVAQALRLTTTLEAFADAAHKALRAGHQREALLAMFEQAVRQAPDREKTS